MPPLPSWLRRRAKPVAWVLGVTVLVRISGLASPESKPDNKPGEHQPQYSVTKLALPGASGLVSLDYIVYDHKQHRLWVPAADTGSVDVIDAGNKITRIQGLGTARVEFRGKKRIFGPSSVTLGPGVVYVGSRGDASICVIDETKLTKGNCIKSGSVSEGLAAAPDSISYVGTTRELWVTTGAPPVGVPAAERAIKIYNASPADKLKPSGKVPLPGSAEGYAVDDDRGRFYTNVEEKGETIAIDVRRRAVIATWRSGCDEPHGVALDRRRGFLFVACSARVVALNLADGRVRASLNTGDGVDNIDFWRGKLYAAAADAAKLTVAQVDDAGNFSSKLVIPTTRGTRTVVAGEPGSAYLIDPYGGSILRVDMK